MNSQRPSGPPVGTERIPTTIHKDLAEISGATVPFTVEVPDNVSDPHPLYVVHGYLGKPFAYERFRDAAAQNKRIVVDISPPRHQGVASLHPRNLVESVVDPMKLLSRSIWGVTKKLRADYEDVVDPSRVDVAAHSQGWPVLVKFVQAHPGVVRVMANVEGAGNEDHHHTLDFIPRVEAFITEEAIPYIGELRRGEHHLERGVARAALSEAHYVFAHPLRTVAEGFHVSNSHVVDHVREIQRSQPNVRTVAILGEADRLIPPEPTVSYSWGMFDAGVVLPGSGHLLQMRQPELAATTILGMIDGVK